MEDWLVEYWELESLHRHRAIDRFLDAVKSREIRAIDVPYETEHFTVISLQDKDDGIEFTFRFGAGEFAKTMTGWVNGVGILQVQQ